MFCLNCGTQLPDEASFCWKCGKSQGGTVASSERTSYEYCTIELSEHQRPVFFKGGQRRLIATAFGSSGLRQVGMSPEFTYVPYNEDEMRQALSALVSELQAEGWAMTGEKGSYPWSYKFKRLA